MGQTSKTLEIFEALVAPIEGLEIKGAKSSYCSVNGNMICFLTSDDQLALRLNQADRDKFLKLHEDCVCVQHSTVMKNYVLVPDLILNKNRKLKPLFKKCLENAYALKAKPTKRKTAKKKTKASKKKVAVKKKSSSKKASKSNSAVKKKAKKKK